MKYMRLTQIWQKNTDSILLVRIREACIPKYGCCLQITDIYAECSADYNIVPQN